MADIHRWQHQYLGATIFPKTLSVVEFRAFFTFSEEELAAIRKRFRTQLRVSGALQLGFLKMTGNLLEDTQIIPSKLLRHISAQLELPALTIASLKAIYTRPKTLYEHQWWAMETLGFSKATSEQQLRLLPFLCQEAQYAPSVDVLVDRAKVWLYQHHYLTLADRIIRDIARRAMSESEEALFRLICRQIAPAEFRRIEASVLRLQENTGRSKLEWLQQPPRKKSINAVRERIERIDFLKGLGIHNLDLESVAIEKIRGYASELYGIRPVKYRELKDPARTLRLVCYLKMSLMDATDAAIALGGRITAKIHRTALEKARLAEAESAISQADAFEQIVERANNKSVTDSEVRAYVLALAETLKPRQFHTRAEAARWILSEPNDQVRSLLHAMQKLEIQAEPQDPGKERVDYLQTLYAGKITALPTEHQVHIPTPWKTIIEGEDRERALRGLEAATLIGLRKSLRSGAVYVDHSEKFRGRHRLMIDTVQWEREKTKRYTQLGLPMRPDDLLDVLLAELDTKLKEVDTAVQAGALQIKGGNLHYPRDKAVEKSDDVVRHRDALFERIGVIQLPDLILEMDSRVRFSKIILGRLAKTPTELLQVYAGMLAHGTSLDASTVCLMVPQLTPNQIIAGMKHFEDRDTVRAANDAVVGFHRRLPIASHWGDGTLASADMMSLDVSRKIWLARLDPKRGIPSVGTYTLMSDFWSVIYDQPIILNERQAGVAIEGAIRQREVELDRLAVDTHGYTEFAMAIAKLLGFALCPRLKRITERRFYVPSNMKNAPEGLRDIIIPSISLRRIREEWDQLVRLASSIETGHSTATVALARYGSASSDSPIYRAGVHLGRLIRSIYLCDYFLSEDLRRTVNRILVHGEAVHTLQRAINAGSFSKPRGQREEELYAVSGSLTLLTNLCLAWTAAHMQEEVFGDNSHASMFEDLDWLQHVSPTHYGNINFRGTFSFLISKYQEWLISEPIRASSRK
ncbi:Tn3 family transposase [Sulfuritalea hydrogenivorans]|uniref:Transposase Tn3 n=1 Tax=Sulfuritalea hydrogenivorans sk43H TaxID=1223802 RepID=W0SFR4_9PROT|nr:Tn3 family transposase [Sulfuritalea hydrogenivorans]BAO29615.1 transposase Tn3 [Sulfuritalea hydrogenivorans sk43H]